MLRSACRLALSAGLFLIASGRLPAVDFPGPAPGPAQMKLDDRQLTAQNAVLSLRCTLSDGTAPGAIEVTDRLGRATLRAAGFPPCEVRLAAAGTTPVASWRPAGKMTTQRRTDRHGGWSAVQEYTSDDGSLRLRWELVLGDEANYVRHFLTITPVAKDVAPELVSLVRWQPEKPLAVSVGRVDGSPLVAGGFFAGCEHPLAQNREAGGILECTMPTVAVWKAGQAQRFTAVIGVAQPGQLRRSFLYYIERERARPFQPFLHYNSWYDIAWSDRKMNEAQCLDVIEHFGRELVKRRGVRIDSFVFDDGWDDNRTLWRFHAGFPRGFTPLETAAAGYKSAVGVWLSPWGGYAQAKKERLEYGRTQGFETNQKGFSLAGPKYYARFREACLEMVKRYGVNYFKFDGIAQGISSKGAGKEYAADVDALLRLIADLRTARPDVFVNVTTGTWPSPFWLLSCDSIWRNGADMGFAGPGTKRQQWITYRDMIVRRWIVDPGPLFPISSLMTQGIAQAKLGHASQLGADLKEWEDEVRSFFASGTQLQELYVTPSMLTPAMWDVLAEGARWSRDRTDLLADVHWIGGDPGAGQAYGFAAWSPKRAMLCLRNPSDKPLDYALDVGAALELPGGAATSYQVVSAWKDKPLPGPLTLHAGQAHVFHLAPYEVLVLDAIPAPPTADALPKPWEQLRGVSMQGDLKAFWNVGGGDREYNEKQALAHGFRPVTLVNTYSDYPGKQRENINTYLKGNTANPWKKPDFFERIIRRNNVAARGQGDIFVHDIEFSFEEDADKAWADPQVRAASGAKTQQEFEAAYLRQWATWFSLPCRWAKETYPKLPVGIYGPQPFRRDYWGLTGKSAQQIDGAHRRDAEFWEFIDPDVDFYVASIYVFYDDPGSIYYMASNVEENYLRTRRYGRKPVYAYVWLRYHDSNQKLRGQELNPYLAEAAAVIPYFCGARGLVVWGWEPKRTGQYYHTLPVFVESLGRVSDLSAKIAGAKLVIDEPAHVLWKEKRPLVRKLQVSDDEWIVMAVNPWQSDRDTKRVAVRCGQRDVAIDLPGRRTVVAHVQGDKIALK